MGGGRRGTDRLLSCVDCWTVDCGLCGLERVCGGVGGLAERSRDYGLALLTLPALAIGLHCTHRLPSIVGRLGTFPTYLL